jgi:hypothetical protein
MTACNNAGGHRQIFADAKAAPTQTFGKKRKRASTMLALQFGK